MKDRLSQLGTVVVVACAVAVTGLLVRRELLTRPLSPAIVGREALGGKELPADTWRTLVSGGHTIGDSNAPVTIVEFADFECPACRRLALDGLEGVLASRSQDVRLIFRHWPLPYHRFALPAARAAECAANQGKFAQMAAVLFAKQDSLGLTPFSSFAFEAGIPDSTAFASCVTSTQRMAAVATDTALLKGLDAIGTPTLILNGRVLRGVPNRAQLDSLIDAEMLKASAVGR
ncbi:MAG: thioredoxin domain-containing protein [Gemmatimonadales bacterium]